MLASVFAEMELREEAGEYSLILPEIPKQDVHSLIQVQITHKRFLVAVYIIRDLKINTDE